MNRPPNTTYAPTSHSIRRCRTINTMPMNAGTPTHHCGNSDIGEKVSVSPRPPATVASDGQCALVTPLALYSDGSTRGTPSTIASPTVAISEGALRRHSIFS